MKLSKSIKKNIIVIKLVAFLVSLYIRFVYYTSVWEVVGSSKRKNYWKEKKPFITCFWHERLLMMCYIWPRSIPISNLISGHNDGKFIASVLGHFGMDAVHGSTGRQGDRALRQLLRCLESNAYVGIVPDGPRGPARELSPGVIQMARLSGCDIIPVSYSVKRAITAKSWDKLRIPLPFNKGVFMWGQPISVPRKLSEREFKIITETLQTTLTKLTDAGDAHLGIET